MLRFSEDSPSVSRRRNEHCPAAPIFRSFGKIIDYSFVSNSKSLISCFKRATSIGKAIVCILLVTFEQLSANKFRAPKNRRDVSSKKRACVTIFAGYRHHIDMISIGRENCNARPTHSSNLQSRSDPDPAQPSHAPDSLSLK